MNAEDINPIIEAVYTVVNSFLKKKPEVGKLSTKQSVEFNAAGILISIEISGDIDGQCLLAFSNDDTIKKIAGSMIGMEVEEVNDLVKSAISEFCNMIMGNAATNYSTANRTINIGSPLSVEDNLEFKEDIPFLALPFWISNNDNFELYISTK